GYALLPTLDHAACAKLELERIAAGVERRVELAAALLLGQRLVEPARIVDHHIAAQRSFLALADHAVHDLDLGRWGFGHRRRQLILRRRDRRRARLLHLRRRLG